MSKKLWEVGGQKRKPSVCAINAQSGTSLQIFPPTPSPHRKGSNGNSHKFPANPPTEQLLQNNANYISERSCGIGEAKNANPPFVQSTQKAVRAFKLFLLHHRRIEKAMEIRVNSLQILPRNNSCTTANYI